MEALSFGGAVSLLVKGKTNAATYRRIQLDNEGEMIQKHTAQETQLARSVTRFEPDRTFVEETEDKDSPVGPPGLSNIRRRMGQNPPWTLREISFFIQEAS